MRDGGTNLIQWFAAGGLVGIIAVLFNQVGLRGETIQAVAPSAVAAAGIGCLAGLLVGFLKHLLSRRR